MTATPVDAATLDRAVAALGVDPAKVRAAAWLNAGFPQLALELDGADTVLALQPDHAAVRRVAKIGVVGRHAPGSDADVEVRFFVAEIGIDEDPVTGSLNANLAHWLIGDGRLPRRYVAAQGTKLGRAGRVHVEHDGEALWIGGGVVPLIEGTVTL